MDVTLDSFFDVDCAVVDAGRGFGLSGGRPSGWSWWFRPLLWDVVVEGRGGGTGDDDWAYFRRHVGRKMGVKRTEDSRIAFLDTIGVEWMTCSRNTRIVGGGLSATLFSLTNSSSADLQVSVSTCAFCVSFFCPTNSPAMIPL